MSGMIEYLKHKYETKAIEWKDAEDGREQYSKRYYDMIEALESLGEVTNTYVKIAIFKALAHDEQFLLKLLRDYN